MSVGSVSLAPVPAAAAEPSALKAARKAVRAFVRLMVDGLPPPEAPGSAIYRSSSPAYGAPIAMGHFQGVVMGQ